MYICSKNKNVFETLFIKINEIYDNSLITPGFHDFYEKIAKQCYKTCNSQFSELNDNNGEFFDNFTLMRNTFAST